MNGRCEGSDRSGIPGRRSASSVVPPARRQPGPVMWRLCPTSAECVSGAPFFPSWPKWQPVRPPRPRPSPPGCRSPSLVTPSLASPCAVSLTRWVSPCMHPRRRTQRSASPPAETGRARRQRGKGPARSPRWVVVVQLAKQLTERGQLFVEALAHRLRRPLRVLVVRERHAAVRAQPCCRVRPQRLHRLDIVIGAAAAWADVALDVGLTLWCAGQAEGTAPKTPLLAHARCAHDACCELLPCESRRLWIVAD